jgi:hypothetical protein
MIGLVHDAARKAATSATAIDTKSVRSFDSFAITPTSQLPACWVLLHKVIRVVAVADRDPETTIPIAPHVIDSLLDPNRVGEVGWRLLSGQDAERPLSPGSLVKLAQSEVEQVRYWKPATIGEVLFNHWD